MAKDITFKPDSPDLDATGNKYVQHVVCSFFYYVRAIDLTILHLPITQLYQTHPNIRNVPTKVYNNFLVTCIRTLTRLYVSRIQTWFSTYIRPHHILLQAEVEVKWEDIVFVGSVPKNDHPIKLNGNITLTCAILKLVAASAAEAERGALFLNIQEA